MINQKRGALVDEPAFNELGLILSNASILTVDKLVNNTSCTVYAVVDDVPTVIVGVDLSTVTNLLDLFALSSSLRDLRVWVLPITKKQLAYLGVENGGTW